MIPLVEIARLFAAEGVAVTVITTPCNAQLFQASIDHDISAGRQISVQILNFPSREVGLPEGIENFNAITSPEMTAKIYHAVALLQNPMEQLIRRHSPDCIVSDTFLPWTVDVAEDLGIPSLSFNPTSVFFRCVSHSMKLYCPHEKVEHENESFVIPGLPDPIQMKRSQVQDYLKNKTRYGDLINRITESELRSYGTLANTFFELEDAYVDHFKNVIQRKGWPLGPLSLFCTRVVEHKVAPDRHCCLDWLDNQKPNSVLYVCFGSLVRFPNAQLIEIASALEASEHPFIWAVRKREKPEEGEEVEDEGWLPKGFEARNIEAKRGMFIRGWAPQIQILDHPSVGGFMTHCGWNSVMEAVSAGVPMITWPLFAEQFYNEKFVTRVVKIGVEVGTETWNSGFTITSPVVRREKIEMAVRCLMSDSNEAKEIRRQAEELGVKARNAVEDDGSSCSALKDLIHELKAHAAGKRSH
ncbi:soyasapogenol B glucuronide galactosyltransferase-like [Malania oleifera]|uniref:soyasapogenol B glucuronide galactosyltransferase-like n=1 Tax=Malania oleifera TaxID=397392 RepID=UPI0025AEADD5|nr:soyasapogenol B glucuronide galactosyltransferase-like [Malania oleifera]